MKNYRYHKNHKYHKNPNIKHKSRSSSSSQPNTKSLASKLFVNNFVPVFAKGLARVICLFMGAILAWGIRRLFGQDLQIISEFLSSFFYKYIRYGVNDANTRKTSII